MPDDLAVVALPEAEMLKQAIPQASEADIQALDALDPDARRQRLGNSLYPGVVGLVGDGLASKVTGMLVDQPTAEVLAFISSQEALTIAVYKAVDALPPDVIDALVLEEAGGSLDGSSSRGVTYRLKANRIRLWHRCVAKMISLELKPISWGHFWFLTSTKQ